MSRRTLEIGAYHAGERHMLLTDTGLTQGTPLVVVMHGTAANAHAYAAPEQYRDLNQIARRGITVISADLGNVLKPDGWGNDTSIARLDELIAWAAATLGCVVQRVGLIGDSAGLPTMLGWGWRNPARVGAVVGRGGVTDIQSLYDINALLKLLVDMAYDNTWPAQRAAHDPILNAGLCQPFADRTLLYYGTADTLTPPATQVLPFAAAVGCRAIPVGGVEHGFVTANVHARSQAQFIAQRLAA